MYSSNHRLPQLTGRGLAFAFSSIDWLLDIRVSRTFSFAYSNNIFNREWGTVACRRRLRCWRDSGIRLYVHGPFWSRDHGCSLSTLGPRSAQGRHGQRPMSKQKSENYSSHRFPTFQTSEVGKRDTNVADIHAIYLVGKVKTGKFLPIAFWNR